MHGEARVHPVRRQRARVDPAACGVRLGIALREAAENEASRAGMCLSHWIKRLVENALNTPNASANDRNEAEISRQNNSPNDALRIELDSAYNEKMEELNR